MLSWIGFNALNKSSLDYAALRRDERKQIYKLYVKEQQVNLDNCPVSLTELCSLAPMPSAVPVYPTPEKPWVFQHTGICNKEEGNNPMNYASASISTPATETQDQRKYLTKRLEDVYCNLRDPLEAQFGLIDDEPPGSPKDLAERIAAGKFIIRGYGDDAKNADRYRYWAPIELIQWRDPAKKADTEGFEVARKALKAAKQKALDIIKIDEPKAGLDAIKALEAWTPTGAAN